MSSNTISDPDPVQCSPWIAINKPRLREILPMKMSLKAKSYDYLGGVVELTCATPCRSKRGDPRVSLFASLLSPDRAEELAQQLIDSAMEARNLNTKGKTHAL
jgi:hypothetical protein